MKIRLLAALIPLAAVVLGGCSGGGGGGIFGGGGNNNDESRLRARYTQLERALERENIGDVMALFASNYMDNGYNYNDVRNSTAAFFDQYDNIDEHMNLQSVQISGDYATVYLAEYFDGNDVFQTGSPRVRSTEQNYTDVWHYEHGDWFLVGNQRTTLTKAQPWRWSKERSVKPTAKE